MKQQTDFVRLRIKSSHFAERPAAATIIIKQTLFFIMSSVIMPRFFSYLYAFHNFLDHHANPLSIPSLPCLSVPCLVEEKNKNEKKVTKGIKISSKFSFRMDNKSTTKSYLPKLMPHFLFYMEAKFAGTVNYKSRERLRGRIYGTKWGKKDRWPLPRSPWPSTLRQTRDAAGRTKKNLVPLSQRRMYGCIRPSTRPSIQYFDHTRVPCIFATLAVLPRGTSCSISLSRFVWFCSNPSFCVLTLSLSLSIYIYIYIYISSHFTCLFLNN